MVFPKLNSGSVIFIPFSFTYFTLAVRGCAARALARFLNQVPPHVRVTSKIECGQPFSSFLFKTLCNTAQSAFSATNMLYVGTILELNVAKRQL